MTASFQPSSHSLHPEPPVRKKGQTLIVALRVILGISVLAAAGSYGWLRYKDHVQKKQETEQRAQALLEVKARKDAAILAELESKKKESAEDQANGAEDQTNDPTHASSVWTREVKVK